MDPRLLASGSDDCKGENDADTCTSELSPLCVCVVGGGEVGGGGEGGVCWLVALCPSNMLLYLWD